MNQQKTGEFLKQLRKEKGLTQEQLAERFSVSSRTVSRWETGRNLPDVDMLIALADFYAVDVREILDGERKTQTQQIETNTVLKQVAEYAAQEEKRSQSKWVYAALGICVVLLVCTKLFVGETKGLLYGVVAPELCDRIMLAAYGLSAALVVAYLKCYWFQEKPARGAAKRVKATVASKEVKPGTYGSGRSKGGYSYVIGFSTEEGETLELFAYELEFGGLKEGKQGVLTYQDRYFIRFEETPPQREQER